MLIAMEAFFFHVDKNLLFRVDAVYRLQAVKACVTVLL